MRFKLIVFDWDGTLMDSEGRILDCMQGAFGDLGLPPREPQEVREVIGLGLEEAVAVLLPDAEPDLRRLLAGHYRQRYLGELGMPTPLFPGAAEVVAQLAAQGYLLAVATGKGRRGLNRALESSGLGPLFHATRCPDEAPSKPHPGMLEQLMEELGVEPRDTLMVGDTEYDMQMARNAGARALAVGYGVHGGERLLAQGALACLADVREIPSWLDGSRSGEATHVV
jgi:phosphoglycolate phosphatase